MPVVAFRVAVAVVLVVVAVSDVRRRLIPNALILPGCVAALAAMVLMNRLSNALLGLAVAGGAFLVFYVAGRLLYRGRALGEGDVKLAGFIGLALGFPASLWAIVLSSIAGAVLAIVYIARGKGRTGTLPYGPALVAGAILVMILTPP